MMTTTWGKSRQGKEDKGEKRKKIYFIRVLPFWNIEFSVLFTGQGFN